MAVGGGYGGGRKVVVVVVLMVMVSPVLCQTGNVNSGVFQLNKSCGSPMRLSHLAVNNTMWLRPTKEDVTLVLLENLNKTCVLPPNTTHQVTVDLYTEIQLGGAAVEEEEEEKEVVCFFPKYPVFALSRGVVMVSCLPEKSQAEAELLDAEDSPSSTPPPIMHQPRAYDPPATPQIPHHTPTTLRPHSSHEQLIASTTLQPPRTGTGVEHLETTVMVTGTAMKTTPRKETAEVPHNTSAYMTEAETTDGTDGTTLAPLSTNNTQETALIETLTPPTGTQLSDTIKMNSFAQELLNESKDHTPGQFDDQVIYLASAGAGVLALMVAVVAVTCLAYRRKRQEKANETQDLFISGGYRDSMNNPNDSQGACLNAHVMYSGAEPEFAESFELEERILNSGVSYSAHDIPKCLKDS